MEGPTSRRYPGRPAGGELRRPGVELRVLVKGAVLPPEAYGSRSYGSRRKPPPRKP